jgi:hypothetical protein
VLKVISRSTFDLQTVLDTLTASATRLCQADKGAIFVKDRESYRLAAHFGFSPEEEQLAKQYAREQPLEAGRGSLVGRVVMDRRVVHIEDVLADDEYQASDYQKAFGFRSDLGVPLLREGAVVGVFALMRTEVNSFTNKEIELVSTFAAQAVIAIENTRLLNEFVNLCSSRPPLPMSSRSSVVRRSICRSCSIHWSSPQRAYARQTVPPSTVRKETPILTLQVTASRVNTMSTCANALSCRGAGRYLGVQ